MCARKQVIRQASKCDPWGGCFGCFGCCCCQTCFVERMAGHSGRPAKKSRHCRHAAFTDDGSAREGVWVWPDKNFRYAPRTPPELGRQQQQQQQQRLGWQHVATAGRRAACEEAGGRVLQRQQAAQGTASEGYGLRGNCLSERDGESESAQPPSWQREGRLLGRAERRAWWAGCVGVAVAVAPTANASTRRFVAEGFLGCVRCDRLIRPRSKRALARQSKTWPQENWQEQGVTSSAPSTAQSPTSDAQRPPPPAKSILLVSALFSLFLFLASKDAPLPPAIWFCPVQSRSADCTLAYLDALWSGFLPPSSSSSSSSLHFQALHSNSTTPCQE